jgi:superfamily II DNA or RNA helicase
VTSPFHLPEFQVAGLERARSILDRYNGVLIADPTGAGKTFIGLALIEQAVSRGVEPVLVTGPASLRSQWTEHLRRIERPDPGPEPDGHEMSGRPAINWLSHTALSLGRWSRRWERPRLVVVDEAHAFRNPRTRRYRALARICCMARVVLLTATPVHNSLLDLYFQLRLFLSDDGLADLGVPDLRHAFLRADAGPGPMPESLSSGLDRISIRRSRKEIEDQIRRVQSCDHENAGPYDVTLRFPIREPTAVVGWSHPGNGFDDACATIEELTLLPFGLDTRGGTGSVLMRFHLLKRLESSAAAFGDSLQRLMRYLESFLDSLDQGFLLRPDDRRALTRGASDAQLFLAPLALQPIPPGCDRLALTHGVGRDLEALRTLYSQRRPACASADPKIEALGRLLSDTLSVEPVLVFTEFRATASEVWRRLGRRHRIGLIHGGGAWLGTSRASRSEVVRAFAPRANGAAVAQAHRVRVLVATDVLAEGWNLQDARDVVSFDLPWNPVRLIQRIGRIDRLGSPHATVRCHNFMPDHHLESMLRLVERLAAKLDAIRSTRGETAGVLEGATVDVTACPVAAAGRDGSAALTDSQVRAIAPGVAPGRSADRLRKRLLRLLVAEPGGASRDLCLRADPVLEFLARPHRIGIELELDAVERAPRGRPQAPADSIGVSGTGPSIARNGAASLLDRLDSIRSGP